MNNTSAKRPSRWTGSLRPLGWLLCLAAPLAQASLLAQLDRHQLTLDETLELTLESSDNAQFSTPDLSPLEADFLIKASRQQNDANTGLRWQISLQPRHSGNLQIPALRLGQDHSQAISLEVLERSSTDDSPLPEAAVFMRARLDHERIYVQEQVILTLYIYHSVPLYDDSSLSPLYSEDVHIETLGPASTYEKTLQGIRHGVIERRYALFPQRSGVLSIPSLTFSATPVASTGHEPKAIRVESPALALQVQPRPAQYPADAPWIPAQQLSLSEDWNLPANARLHVGDALTRRLRIQAEGLSAAQLPPLPATRLAGLRSYADQPSLNNSLSAKGLSSQREQREALIPTQAGSLQLADIDVFWWNTRADRLEQIHLPGRLLQVEALAGPTPEPRPDRITPPSPVTEDPSQPWWTRLLLWQISTAIFACSSLLGFALWWRARRQPAIARAPVSGPSERSLLDDLRRACLANDTQSTRQALDAWARQQPETLADMAARFIPLSDALDGLNGALYSEAGQHWQGEALWLAITRLPSHSQEGQEQKQSTLPPLYPH